MQIDFITIKSVKLMTTSIYVKEELETPMNNLILLSKNLNSWGKIFVNKNKINNIYLLKKNLKCILKRVYIEKENTSIQSSKINHGIIPFKIR